jgi:hypothetical protein
MRAREPLWRAKNRGRWQRKSELERRHGGGSGERAGCTERGLLLQIAWGERAGRRWQTERDPREPERAPPAGGVMQVSLNNENLY